LLPLLSPLRFGRPRSWPEICTRKPRNNSGMVDRNRELRVPVNWKIDDITS
jgi:hypothetical protein